ncbi:hypothetical protein [Zooshikella harenae]|uniref:HEAT repeat domain-containing protein n=1 Tax=Zooshikella harenae TaxID=2827238 RepID=A0ABS5ZLP6_9GAMM|nr:hypothetical protein [Zooshikella harenae]MBU2714375.1 hypothetical protein [Zooshikella harenae]
MYIEYAGEIFEGEHDKLIPIIVDKWNSWPINRQEHLACILGYVGSAQEKELILQMIGSNNKQVANRAKEALNEFNGNA